MISSVRLNEIDMFVVTMEDSTVLFVPDDMENSDRQAIARWVSSGGKVEPYVAPPASEPGPVILPAGVFFDRTTEEEADAIDEAMMSQPVKFRRAWAAATVFRSDNDLWPVLRAAIVELYGYERADELLAPPNAEMMMAPAA